MRINKFEITDNFIDKLCGFVDEEYLSKGKSLERTAFVFEGKRPSLFMKKKISSMYGGGFLSPTFFSIDEFMKYALKKTVDFKALSNMDSWHMIYKLSSKMAPEIVAGREKFSDFMPWAREIASFIDVLDFEDVSEEGLRNIESSASIGYDIPNNINRVLDKVSVLRREFHSEQRELNLLSRGYAYNLLLGSIEDTGFPEFDRIYFCGFYYIQKTVAEVIRSLCKKGIASLFIQGDSDDNNIFGKFSQDMSGYDSKYTGSPDKIKLHSVFDVHSQVAAVREILKETDDPGSTVIVLPDPSVMLPLVSEIGNSFGDFNISLGYPMKRSSLYSLIELISRAQTTKKDNRYYVKDYVRVLSHPLVKNLSIVDEPGVSRIVIHKIEEAFTDMKGSMLAGSIFAELCEIEDEDRVSKEIYDAICSAGKDINEEDVEKVIMFLHDNLFRVWENIYDFASFSDVMKRFVDLINAMSVLAKYPLNLKVAKRLYDINEDLRDSSFSKEAFERDDIFRIFNELISNEIMAFAGSPLKGLQILGILETRTLDFKNVIIMDANESRLPRLRKYHPLIPHEITRSLGIDMLGKEEKIQHHLFRRLIAYADKVDIIYEDNTGKERSRFIEGIEWDIQKQDRKFSGLDISRYSFDVNTACPDPGVNKTKDMVDLLRSQRYSATSLNTYLQCPMKFYYNYVIRLKEKEDISEDIEGREIGSFIHDLLEDEFSVFVGKKPEVTEDFMRSFFVEYDKRFNFTFKKKMKADSFLLDRIMRYRLEKFLKYESKRLVKEILYLERSFEETLSLPSGDFSFKYIVDRVDRMESGELLILDYKTGLDAKKPVETKKLENMVFSTEDIKRSIRSFQLPLYFYFEQKRHNTENIDAALYYLRDPDIDRLITASTDISKTIDICMKALDHIMCEITDVNVPFLPLKDAADNCRFCPFAGICR